MLRGFAVLCKVGAGRRRRGRRREFQYRTGVRIVSAALAVVVLLMLAGCGTATNEPDSAATELRVFAAASLTSTFTAIGEQYMAAHPDVHVTFNFAGSQELATQLEQGAPADVLATADEQTMEACAGLVGEPEVFARNSLQIVVAPGDPLGIHDLADLARDDLKVVLAAPEVPAGAYARQVLATAGVTVKPVSLEDNVKGVVTKVALGEADAGIVYVTDVIAAGEKVAGVDIPARLNVRATYPMAVVLSSESPAAARAFVDLVLSADGQRVMREAGFVTATGE